MRPPRKSEIDYERIKKYDEWINGEIEAIELREDHDTGFKDEKTGNPIICDQVRLRFKLDGHEYSHLSRWMRYSYGEKSNLYSKYLKYLVENAQPDMEFDMDSLKSLKVKTMWVQSEDGRFDQLEQIRPIENKVKRSGNFEAHEEVEASSGDEIPF